MFVCKLLPSYYFPQPLGCQLLDGNYKQLALIAKQISAPKIQNFCNEAWAFVNNFSFPISLILSFQASSVHFYLAFYCLLLRIFSFFVKIYSWLLRVRLSTLSLQSAPQKEHSNKTFKMPPKMKLQIEGKI